ncbi:carboxypeptidase-like regulatory domain-containing protein, partial [Negadavirga shengliensis]
MKKPLQMYRFMQSISLIAAVVLSLFSEGLLAQENSWLKSDILKIEKEKPVLASVRISDELRPTKIFDVTITGTVTDQDGAPIPGATVSVPGTNIGTATDIDGKYAITVPEGATLVFSFIG